MMAHFQLIQNSFYQVSFHVVSRASAIASSLLLAGLMMLSNSIDAKPKHPWIADTPKPAADAYFTNIKDGAVVNSPFLVKFGMNEWGIAPAEQDFAKTGHHHLLIDTALPVPIDNPIEFSSNYVHFGKGQMETVLNLKPGKHTLRLLLANHKHVPHMIFSKLVNITVANQLPEKVPQGFNTEPNIELLNITSGQTVGGIFQVQFHASNVNISHKDTKLKGTGHFVLNVTAGGKRERFAYDGGQTETWLKLPLGPAKLSLELVENTGAALKIKPVDLDIVVR